LTDSKPYLAISLELVALLLVHSGMILLLSDGPIRWLQAVFGVKAMTEGALARCSLTPQIPTPPSEHRLNPQLVHLMNQS
jgi:hypothetical protein